MRQKGEIDGKVPEELRRQVEGRLLTEQKDPREDWLIHIQLQRLRAQEQVGREWRQREEDQTHLLKPIEEEPQLVEQLPVKQQKMLAGKENEGDIRTPLAEQSLEVRQGHMTTDLESIIGDLPTGDGSLPVSLKRREEERVFKEPKLIEKVESQTAEGKGLKSTGQVVRHIDELQQAVGERQYGEGMVRTTEQELKVLPRRVL